jgi:hypothetical protein
LSIPCEKFKKKLKILKLVDHVNQPGRNGPDCPILAEFLLLLKRLYLLLYKCLRPKI